VHHKHCKFYPRPLQPSAQLCNASEVMQTLSLLLQFHLGGVLCWS